MIYSWVLLAHARNSSYPGGRDQEDQDLKSWQEGRKGEEINECYSKTQETWSWGILPGDQRRVTSPQRLKQSMK
jgi:hypothetical protein